MKSLSNATRLLVLCLVATTTACSAETADTDDASSQPPVVSLPALSSSNGSKPNIILIMVDDMGFSDIGSYGGEIDTPNIDTLAAEGLRFSRFYNSSRCCPTRASLLTGLHSHLTGIGSMTHAPRSKGGDFGPDYPGYRGYLNRECVTLAEVLKPAGYATLMTGKWHLGYNDKNYWPLQRGFEKYYGCISGATRFFHPTGARNMVSGNEVDTEMKSTTERPFYTTDAFTDHAIRFIEEENASDDRPFFLYLAYTAPHWPHQAHEEDIAKYRGKYLKGWDKIRQERYQRQIDSGLIDPKWKLSPRDKRVPAWDSLDEDLKNELDMRMAVYAAMVDRVDQNIGKLLDTLDKLEKTDDTLIIFLSDNGACAEGALHGRGEIFDAEKRNQEHGNNYGSGWANASSTPFRLYKHYTHEGGSATPFIMRWPNRIKPQSEWYDHAAQVIDLMPTVLEITDTTYPSLNDGTPVHPLRGVSLTPSFDGEPLDRSDPMYSEHIGAAMIVDGDWKLVSTKHAAMKEGIEAKGWELYNLKDDRTELNNLAKKKPRLAQQLGEQWEAWAHEDRVYPKPPRKR